jgi:hypothetical protein
MRTCIFIKYITNDTNVIFAVAFYRDYGMGSNDLRKAPPTFYLSFIYHFLEENVNVDSSDVI